jgi:hypothetical protein
MHDHSIDSFRKTYLLIVFDFHVLTMSGCIEVKIAEVSKTSSYVKLGVNPMLKCDGVLTNAIEFDYFNIASASISTSISGRISLSTSTMVVAG